ncbi:MAG: phosphoenolpyruvate--protein phosphotransferase [Verrucomicrobiales bacterium]|nr:phosphoenolpyruvate--protein phosphotransferase [Verrucomicrobiales bacterium]
MSHPVIREETRLQGIGVSPGISCGQAALLGKALLEPEERKITVQEIEPEKERLKNALAVTRVQISELQQRIMETAGADHASIFDAHLLLLEDSTVLGEVVRRMEMDLCSIDWAYFKIISQYADSLRKISDPYLRERAIDIEDVAQRVLKNLRWPDGNWLAPKMNENASIVLARDLTPSDTIGFDRDKVKGFATEAGSATSHTAIMAHSLNIPAVVALHDFKNTCLPGDHVLVDGYKGLVIINPSPDTLNKYGPLIERENQLVDNLSSLKDADTATADGKRIILSANIEFVDELNVVAAQGAEGVGLYRTEFFYLTDKTLQSEDNQTENYKRVAEACDPHGVIIRTLDLGGDKLLPELFEEPQPNPFLGWRGVRVSLDRPEEFKVQLRAILRASAFGKTRVMYPFISNLGEVQDANSLLEEAKNELRDRGVPFDEHIERGAMIEIPSAVMVADHIAREIDFFSIGTNDLVQYTTAVDRVNDRVANLYRPAHPAVIEMIHLTAEAAHRNGIWVGICGEAASDLRLTPIWIGLGIDELSVGPAQVLRLRKAISCLSTQECIDLAKEARTKGRAREVMEISNKLAGNSYPELLESPS